MKHQASGTTVLASEVNKRCCSPSVTVEHTTATASSSNAAQVPDREDATTVLERMIELPGGAFLMSSDSEESFPGDGEGPVREVMLDPFWIDRSPVTNDVFARFILATGYVTEAERYGWSFVFWSHIPEKSRAELVEDTVAGAPWWCKVRQAKCDTPEGLGSSLRDRGHHPVVHVTWNDAQAFCRWSGQRLPTEAEGNAPLVEA